ncbi:MAG: DNA repair protein RecN [Actinobacteria bacterium]|nr:DNA repair protein RecN [Actinomycetota bacterium]
MLRDLLVENLGVIQRAEVAFDPGCSALTGETGAGKTLLVAALGLLRGGRADRTLVRRGATEARVEGRFELAAGHAAGPLLVESGALDRLERDVMEVVVSRTIGDGRGGKVRINGRITALSTLEQIGSSLVEIAGQHEHQRLSSASYQRGSLDDFAGEEAVALAGDVRDAVRASIHAGRIVDELRAEERERARELDVLRYEIQEIEGAGLVPGELERLRRDASRLEHAETIGTGVASALELLRAEGGVEESLAQAARLIGELGPLDDRFEPVARRLDSLSLEVADVASELRAADVTPDPDALADTRGRLDALAKLRRKYGDDEEEISAYLERSRTRAAELDATGSEMARWEGERQSARERAVAAAERLSSIRRDAARRLEKALTESLGELALPGARVEVALTPRDLYEGGAESVAFNVAMNGGEELRPLAKVASGGELSRTALALHLLTSSREVPTLVFDEVDAGVGGRAARSVGEKLSRLAETTGAQVLVVTHLPQVAAFAHQHLSVEKLEAAGRTSAVVRPVTGTERVEELSRMLAGMPESGRAREHALELLELAGRPTP